MTLTNPAETVEPYVPEVQKASRGWSIGFGLENLGLVSVARPRLMLVLSLAFIILSVMGAVQLRFADDPVSLFRADSPAFRTYDAFASRFADGSATVAVIVDGNFSDPEHWSQFQALAGGMGTLDPVQGSLSALDLNRLEAAAGPAVDMDALFDMEDEPTAPLTDLLDQPPQPASPQTLADHPLNGGRLLARDLSAALIMVDLAFTSDNGDSLGGEDRLALTQAFETGLGDLQAAEAPDLTVQLSGLPVVRGEVIKRIFSEQPLLLSAGLAIGFFLGVLLLGVLADAVVVAVMPVLAILGIYGAFGWLGIPMTVLLNDLPLLVLALAFASSMHLVYAARRDLHAANYDFAALKGPICFCGPACALSALTTMAAFLTFTLSGSEAIAEFGVIGACAVGAVFLASMVLHPVSVWVALKLGWRPKPPMQARKGAELRGWTWIAQAMEGISLHTASYLDARRRVVTGLAAVTVVTLGIAHLQVAPDYSPFEDIPQDSQVYEAISRLNTEFGGAQTIHLPLPLTQADASDADPMTGALELARIHRAVEAALPGATVFSAWSVVEWLQDTGRPVSRPRLESVFEAAPEGLSGLILSRDGRQPALAITLAADTNAELVDAAAKAEAAAGAALGQDLTGAATGLAVLAARSSIDIITRLSLGLLLAAVAAAGLVGLAFRSARVIVITLIPNLLPVVAIGATLYLLGLPLRITSALAMTVALGIAVDDTVHLINGYWHLRPFRTPRAALCRALRLVGPVLVVTSLVLILGLSPAYWSWSPGISTFAAFAVMTIGIALLTCLFALPALLATLARNRPR